MKFDLTIEAYVGIRASGVVYLKEDEMDLDEKSMFNVVKTSIDIYDVIEISPRIYGTTGHEHFVNYWVKTSLRTYYVNFDLKYSHEHLNTPQNVRASENYELLLKEFHKR